MLGYWAPSGAHPFLGEGEALGGKGFWGRSTQLERLPGGAISLEARARAPKIEAAQYQLANGLDACSNPAVQAQRKHLIVRLFKSVSFYVSNARRYPGPLESAHVVQQLSCSAPWPEG